MASLMLVTTRVAPSRRRPWRRQRAERRAPPPGGRPPPVEGTAAARDSRLLTAVLRPRPGASTAPGARPPACMRMHPGGDRTRRGGEHGRALRAVGTGVASHGRNARFGTRCRGWGRGSKSDLAGTSTPMWSTTGEWSVVWSAYNPSSNQTLLVLFVPHRPGRLDAPAGRARGRNESRPAGAKPMTDRVSSRSSARLRLVGRGLSLSRRWRTWCCAATARSSGSRGPFVRAVHADRRPRRQSDPSVRGVRLMSWVFTPATLLLRPSGLSVFHSGS